MSLIVHSLRTFPTEAESDLRRQLTPAVQLTIGDDIPTDADILIADDPSAEQLQAAPHLRAVVVPFAGPPKALRTLLQEQCPDVTLHNLHHNAASTAEHILALLLAAARNLVPSDASLRRNDWRIRYPIPTGRAILLEGKTAVVLGYGEIGRRVARGCKGLGMHVVAVKRTATEPDAFTDEIATIDTLHKQLQRADVLAICLPGTDKTRGLISSAELELLPPTAIVVNGGRGYVIDEGALYHALEQGQIFAAGLDVWWQYPQSEADQADTPPSAYPFHKLDNVVMTPHKGGDALEINELRMQHLAHLLNTAATGEPIPNQIDLDQGY